ncbi:MAG: glycoside hydrolase family 3 C-terminal domain-containing protein [Gammaproteobacteria bacterium]|nr:glycoside hydrolase family 3 C-terminal domain-containing protein [Gammaproteobacteria bacterium]
MTREEAATLVAKMTLAEKADFCSGADVWRLPANKRLGLPAIMLTDGPHGLRKQATDTDDPGLDGNVPATCFPTASALASTWDVDLLRAVGVALGAESAAADVAVLLGPAMNIKRHPLCGRNFEYFSEDPLLSGELAAAMVDGIQSQGVGACIKHFAANDQEHRRMVTDVVVDERTLREIHLRGFETAVKRAAPWMVMAAYNRLNGVYCSENHWLLNQVLRRDWGFQGSVVTDWGAANDRVRGIEAGDDLEMPTSGGINDRRIIAAVECGELDEEDLDRSVARSVELILKNLEGHRPVSPPDFDAHHALARTAAVEGTVLLKNDNELLPLSPASNIAVIGAFAKTPRYQGTGSSRVTPTRLDCAFDALGEMVSEPDMRLSYAAGYDPGQSGLDGALISDAVAVAAAAEVALVFVGLPAVYESEGFDRTHMRLPDQHDRLIEAVASANPNTVVVLANGAPVEMPWIDAPKAILEAYLGGQAGGAAVVDILFGRHNPCGKLAETFPLGQDDVPSNRWFPGSDRQVQYREGLYVGYRYFDSFDRPVLFPFGHGLSYTHFRYDNLEVLPENDSELPCRVMLTLTNAGKLDGAEVVQLYVRSTDRQGPYRPRQELCAFRKIRLRAGESRNLTIELGRAAFTLYDVRSADWVAPAGEYEIRVGASSRDTRLCQRVVLSARGSDVGDASTDPDSRPRFRNGRLEVDDDAFAAMLGTPVPACEGVRPFHLNSTLSEIATTWLGRRVANAARSQFVKRMGGADPATKKMIEHMADDMPLRSLVLFFGGRVSFATAEALAAVLNGRPLKALRLLVLNR